jgi:hypothetical protein
VDVCGGGRLYLYDRAECSRGGWGGAALLLDPAGVEVMREALQAAFSIFKWKLLKPHKNCWSAELKFGKFGSTMLDEG